MKKSLACLALLALTTAGIQAHAANSINLSNYNVSGTYALDILNGSAGGISGLEASAVTYAQDRNSLFFVGDEGTGVVEISLTGQTLGFMNFNWAGTGSSNNDAEGLTYLGNGVLVVAEERLQNAYQFSYSNGGTVNLANSLYASFGPTIGNVGIEGISYDARNGNFVTAKQDNPAQLSIYNSVSFSNAAAADAVPSIQFSGASSVLGLNSLSDVQTLSSVNSLANTAGADNILVLSLDSRKLIEIDRQGNQKSSLDLANIFPRNNFEGLTIDQNGTIYLVAEQDQMTGALAGAKSQLIVLTAPVPEPETYAMLLAGLGLIGFAARRQKKFCCA